MPQLHFIFLFFITIKLCFALHYYLRLAIYRLPLRDNQIKADSISISAIICYHNESENISQSVDALFNQSYNKLEIVLVDDLSSDNTYDQLIKFSGHNSIVAQNHTPNFGKKLLKNGCCLQMQTVSYLKTGQKQWRATLKTIK